VGAGLDAGDLDDGAFGGTGLEGAGSAAGAPAGAGAAAGAAGSTALPPSALGLTKGALVDRNMRVFASALREVFTGKPIILPAGVGGLGPAGSGGGGGGGGGAAPGTTFEPAPSGAPGSARRRP
jgi:hypothetical protein